MNTLHHKIKTGAITIVALSLASYFVTLSYRQIKPVPLIYRQPQSSCDCAEYQISLDDDGATITDGDRRVGFLPFDSTAAFDKLMLRDNE